MTTSMSGAEVVTIGEPLAVFAATEPNVSLVAAQRFQKFVAGAELNVAVGLARLGHSVSYVSAVGQDPLGQFILDQLQAAHVDHQHVQVSADYWTGFYLKQRVTQGDPATYYYRKNSAAANLDPQVLASLDLTHVKLGHLSGIFAALSTNDQAIYRELNRRLLAVGATVVFDPNLRPTLWPSRAEMCRVTNQLARDAQIVLPGLNEGTILTGEADPVAIADFYLQQSTVTQVVIVKLGAAGALLKVRGQAAQRVPGVHVDSVVDTVGAGDGFAVGLISGLLAGVPITAAVQRACAIGALAVTTPGDNDGYPTPAQLTRFYREHHLEA
ncbi:sugar kinase [Levilactobacillus brevis]|uniref:2-dehydro-3-deoxygluconokinase n=1 Tax=Levilactobacillus brevis KB290 TaxID=1001583 RepID=M5AXI9_LEVBR|nr:sugar kinase [Levilactobacillus brevis]MCM6798293.1 sugar kinase [Levilactobacillus brevis]MCM6800761.1 sugar kinase [Levilactobacillus brevis]MCM6806243.1 sugar kinase [Levilactobacillus brevis]MCM6808581.1 sugar kinase [Levilactobacillus brevis]MCM6814468.1 sugar kinase [Levilactobacillus brevis]